MIRRRALFVRGASGELDGFKRSERPPLRESELWGISGLAVLETPLTKEVLVCNLASVLAWGKIDGAIEIKIDGEVGKKKFSIAAIQKLHCC